MGAPCVSSASVPLRARLVCRTLPSPHAPEPGDLAMGAMPVGASIGLSSRMADMRAYSKPSRCDEPSLWRAQVSKEVITLMMQTSPILGVSRAKRKLFCSPD